MKKSIAIITARGGSKRILRKNIRMFIGKPIIAYSIGTALESGIFDEVMVSTDNTEIAGIARQLGAQVPFLRSEKNSDDNATTADVISEVIDTYRKLAIHFQYVCCIYPTAVFVTAEMLSRAKKVLEETSVDSVIPVVRFDVHIERALKKESDGSISFLNPQHIQTKTQDLPVSFHDAGQFYWLKIKSFERHRALFMKRTFGMEIDPDRVQDIDTEEDWQTAEKKFRLLSGNKKHV